MNPLGELLPTYDQDAEALMGKSANQDEVSRALTALDKALPVLFKDKTGETGRSGPNSTYQYFNLDQVMHKLRPVLQARGFILSHTAEQNDGCWFVTNLWFGGVVVRDSRCPFTPDSRPRNLGSQITYLRRYTICMMFGIVADKDDDGAAAMEPAETEAASGPASEGPDPIPAIDELSLRGNVASMSEESQQRLRDELIEHAETHGVSMPQVGELIKASASGKVKLAELTAGQVNSLFCEIEGRGKGS